MWFEGSFFKYTVGIVLVLLIILLLYYTSPVFSPILWFVTAIFLPILFSTLLYYILRPLINVFERYLPRYLSILIIYFIIIIAGAIIVIGIIPDVIEAFRNISPEKIESVNSKVVSFVNNLKTYIHFTDIPGLEGMVIGYLPKINTFIYQSSINLITTLASIAISIALTPFVLYYFFRDDTLFSKYVLRFVPVQFAEEVKMMLEDIDSTLSEFITAQMTIAGVIGLFLFCGYVIIGLPHALALALFAMIFYVIPFVGTFIALIPALIVGLTVSFSMVLKVLAVMYVAHFIETNLLSPRLMSQRLKIHPLTIILLLLAAGTLYGILGLLLVTPTYAILKVIVWNLYKIFGLHYSIAKNRIPPEHSETNNEKI